jgi:hypothetical protein
MSAPFLGMGGKSVAVKLSDLKTDNNRMTLDRTKEQLQQMANYRLENRNTGAGSTTAGAWRQARFRPLIHARRGSPTGSRCSPWLIASLREAERRSNPSRQQSFGRRDWPRFARDDGCVCETSR